MIGIEVGWANGFDTVLFDAIIKFVAQFWIGLADSSFGLMLHA